MKIFHCADLHLESPFSALSPQAANKRKKELLSVFFDMMSFVKDEGFDLVLISGDLFDTVRVSDEARDAVKKEFAALSCPVVISPGNHDKYIRGSFYSDSDMPENVCVFNSSEVGRFDFDELGASVWGYAFTGDVYEKNPLLTCPELPQDCINILCAHGDTVTLQSSQMAPLNVSEIASKGFAFAALGHIHKPPEPKNINGCTVAYSGFAQGRDFGECGKGNANIVEIDRDTKRVQITKKSFSKSRFELERLDVFGCTTDDEIIKRLEKTVSQKGYAGDVSLRVKLLGTVDKDFHISTRKIEGAESFSSLALIEVQDETVGILGFEDLEKDMTAMGEFYRLLLPMINSPSEEERSKAMLALKIGLSALSSGEIGLIGSEDEEDEVN